MASYRYDPYGNTISSSGGLAGANVYRFSSKERHSQSGIYYYSYRFYDPNLQRWLNRDPLDERGFQLKIVRRKALIPRIPIANHFIFVDNSPSRIDPYGLLDLLPEDSAENCFINCVTKKNNAPGVGKATKRYAVGHIIGIAGTAVCGAAAIGEGGVNLVADGLLVGFGAFEAYEVYKTVEELDRLRREAKAAFATCLMKCARTWGDFEGAYDYWDQNTKKPE